ncbi:hypothetical protein [Ralstonia solanacearum]|nr:hypothetical protein [Ralstonia solanacearum]MBB6588456.1 hypothetical protein [Ralstonia solanacearum]MCG3576301.1 hypothetical protein [Ralstonia solanacearum]MCL9824547.1 hypothetical protein [Ralstonia solanacearum]MCL9829765.1 hypothetical protein [Ralstonia solanacearum]MCL9834546.1 hypothetical protein [Ralstonia solanacearum]
MDYLLTLGSVLLNSDKKNPVVTLVPTAQGPVAQIFAPREDLAARQNWVMRNAAIVNARGWLVEEVNFTIDWDGATWALAVSGPNEPIRVARYDPVAGEQQWLQLPGYQGRSQGSAAILSATTGWPCLDLNQSHTADGSPIYTRPFENSDAALSQFWGLGNVRELPPSSGKLHTVAIAETILMTARENEAFRSILLSDPASIFVSSGYPVLPGYRDAFNDFVRNDQSVQMLLVYEGPLTELEGWSCKICKIGFWFLAAVIMSVGAGALVTLTVEAPLVIAVAAAVGSSTPAAQAWLTAAASLVVLGIDAVLTSMCEWAGICGSADVPRIALSTRAVAAC